MLKFEFVRQWPHLGNLINDICDDKNNILKNAIQCADKFITSYVFLVRWMLLLRHSCWFFAVVCMVVYFGILIMFSLLRFAWLGVRASGEIGVTTLLILIVNFYRICDSIPFLDVVFCRNTNCINCCLNSSSEILHYVTRHGFFSRMRSPIGSNALRCC